MRGGIIIGIGVKRIGIVASKFSPLVWWLSLKESIWLVSSQNKKEKGTNDIEQWGTPKTICRVLSRGAPGAPLTNYASDIPYPSWPSEKKLHRLPQKYLLMQARSQQKNGHRLKQVSAEIAIQACNTSRWWCQVREMHMICISFINRLKRQQTIKA